MNKREFEIKYDILLSIAEMEAKNYNMTRSLMFIYYAKEVELKYNLEKYGMEHKIEKYKKEVTK